MVKRLPLTLFTALLAGCALGPDYQRPAEELPTQWPAAVTQAMTAQTDWAEWWKRYQDPVLDRLVAEALANNLDVRIAAANIAQARAALGLSEAQRYPTHAVQADAARGEGTSELLGGSGSPANTFRIAGTLNYEIDLWGRLSRATEAARAQLLQVSFAADAIRLALVTDVVVGYFDLRAVQQQIRTTTATIESRREAYRLEQSRVRNGASTELTLRQTEAELARAEAQLPLLQRQEAQLRRALARLTGAGAAALLDPPPLPEGELSTLNFSTELPERLPSALLERRPDIRAAEAALIASNANVGVARAAFFPQLNLAGTLGTGAREVGDLFSGPATLWQIGGSVFASVLDFGRRRAVLESAQAARDAAELQYRATVRDAFRDVGNAWTLLETANRRLTALNRQVEALEAAVRLAERRYQIGYAPFLDLLDARRALFDAQLAQIEAARDRLAATATLFKALGGGWGPEAAEYARAGE